MSITYSASVEPHQFTPPENLAVESVKTEDLGDRRIWLLTCELFEEQYFNKGRDSAPKSDAVSRSPAMELWTQVLTFKRTAVGSVPWLGRRLDLLHAISC